jgi:hypothetical protein
MTLGPDDFRDAQMAARWYAHFDDTIGGWCVMPVDQPPSTGIPAVASFVFRAAAEHIADLHNATLPRQESS